MIASRPGSGPRLSLARVVISISLAIATVIPAGVLGLPGPAGAVSARGGLTRVIGPDVSLAAALHSLHAGDTLVLERGIYRTNYLRMYTGVEGVFGLSAGTAEAPITVTSADPSRPALIFGGLQLSRARYWRLDHLRMQATVTSRSALYLAGGVGWSVTNSEFWGARETNAFANVAIAGSGGEPSGFSFASNCLHDAAATSASNSDQNIYISFAGSASTSGSVARNVIWGSPRGEAIKLGNGGAVNAPGPWNVTITNNTLVSNGRQVLLTGDVRYNRILKNLLVHPTAPFHSDPRTTQIYVNGRIGRGNLVARNYAYQASMLGFDTAHVVRFSANTQSNAGWSDPRFSTVGACSAFHPTNSRAAAYGRYGTT